MVEPAKRSRSVKKVRKNTPGGRKVTHYKSKAHSRGKCGRCGCILAGVKSGGKTSMRKSSKSQRTVARIHGGVLCAKCSEQLVRYRTRMESMVVDGFQDLEFSRDLTLEKYLPRGWYGQISGK